MNSNSEDNDKLTDALLGEAVMNLLNADAPISVKAVIKELHRFAAAGKDPQRQQLCVALIRELRQLSWSLADSSAGDRLKGDNREQTSFSPEASVRRSTRH